MSEEKKSAFKVSDRRKFTAEGESRPDAAPATPDVSRASSGATGGTTTATPQEPPPDVPIAEIRPEVTRPKIPTSEEVSAGH